MEATISEQAVKITDLESRISESSSASVLLSDFEESKELISGLQNEVEILKQEREHMKSEIEHLKSGIYSVLVEWLLRQIL